jgi:hypothetical protein
MPLWTNLGLVFGPQWGNFLLVLKIMNTKNHWNNLSIPGMTVKEFWQHRDKDCTEFEYEKSLVPKHVHVRFTFIMKKFREWYLLNFIEANVPRDIFKTC